MYRYSTVCFGYALLALIILTLGPAESARLGEDGAPSGQNAPTPQNASASKQNILLNFKDVDLRQIIDLMSDLTNQNFLVDEKVRGKVTIISPRPVSSAEAYNIFLSILEVQGFHCHPAGGHPQNYSFPGGEGEPSPYRR